MKDFELLSHTADIKIRVYGVTLAQLFSHALIGMFQATHPIALGCKRVNDRVICNDLPVMHTIEVRSPDREALLVDFLSEALYLSDTYNEAYLDATIHSLTDTELVATIKGVAITGFEVVEIKAVTYHDLALQQKDGIWQTDIVFDI